MAYQIQKHCENVEHVIYEQNEDIGGTVSTAPPPRLQIIIGRR